MCDSIKRLLASRTPDDEPDPRDVRDVRWKDVREGFEDEFLGLRDIYVFGTTVGDWQRVRDLVDLRWPYTYTDDEDEGKPMPSTMQELFKNKENAATSMSWRIELPEGLELMCHFFEREVIEFDFRASWVTGQPDLDVVCKFVRAIGGTLDKPVVVCDEGSPTNEALALERAIMRYDPETDAVVRGAPS